MTQEETMTEDDFARLQHMTYTFDDGTEYVTEKDDLGPRPMQRELDDEKETLGEA